VTAENRSEHLQNKIPEPYCHLIRSVMPWSGRLLPTSCLYLQGKKIYQTVQYHIPEDRILGRREKAKCSLYFLFPNLNFRFHCTAIRTTGRFMNFQIPLIKFKYSENGAKYGCRYFKQPIINWFVVSVIFVPNPQGSYKIYKKKKKSQIRSLRVSIMNTYKFRSPDSGNHSSIN
jgi:hypothetical protein